MPSKDGMIIKFRELESLLYLHAQLVKHLMDGAIEKQIS
jgi:hypothetical protein